jgi:ABC-type anion transport system duplicated permease subunit
MNYKILISIVLNLASISSIVYLNLIERIGTIHYQKEGYVIGYPREIYFKYCLSENCISGFIINGLCYNLVFWIIILSILNTFLYFFFKRYR